jgi:spermidine/putrescine transport system substrate-binding protein
MEEGAMQRRIWGALVALVMALALGACGSSDDGGSGEQAATDGASQQRERVEKPTGTIRVSNWDAYMPEDLIKNFEAKTGIKVELSKHTTNEDIVGKLQAANGGGYDLVFVSGPFVESLAKQGFVAELNHAQIPNLSNLAPEATQLAFDPGNKYSVPYTWGTTGLCYRSDKLPSAPTSWSDLLEARPELKDRKTMLATDRWLFLPALKSLGYSVNETDEAKLQEAADLLKSAKGDLLAYDDTTFYTKLVNGEADLVEAWDGWCNYGIAENDKIKFTIPEEGSDLWVDSMAVLEKSENKAAAEEFINYILDPAVHKSVSELVLYKVPNPKAMALLDAKLLKQYPNLGMTPAELQEQEALRDLGDAQPVVSRLVTEITKG